jgi:hypothetical protein
MINESVKDLVNAIANGDAMNTENSFAQAMSEKLSGMLDDKRQEMAKNMFASEVPVMEEEELDEEYEIAEFDQEQWEALSEEEQAEYEDIPELEEAMTPAMAKAIRAHSSTSKVASGYANHYDRAQDTRGDYGTSRKDAAQSSKVVRKAKKIIKRDGGQATYDRVKKNADSGFDRRNGY